MSVKQTDRVLAYIREFGSITQLEALRDLGVMRLASRISDLRKQGIHNLILLIYIKTLIGKISALCLWGGNTKKNNESIVKEA